MFLTAGTLLVVIALLVMTRISTELVLSGGLVLLFLTDVLTVEGALMGFSNPGLLCVAIFYVVSAGLVQSGASTYWGMALLGEKPSHLRALMRVLPGVSTASAFMNNTPLVSMLVPAMERWCERFNVSPSKVMMPLSFAAILGGSCSLIGTSTNLLVDGMIRQQTDLAPLGFFELAWVGVPVAVLGIIFMLVLGSRLLPDRGSALKDASQERAYSLEMVIEAGSPVIGKSIGDAGLRHLPGAFLAELQRGETLFPAVSPEEILKEGDVLILVGDVSSVLPLMRRKGLNHSSANLTDFKASKPIRKMVEVIISPSNPLIGSTIREGRFRSRYGAVVLAATRGGERIPGKLGDLMISPGDMFLMETRPAFLEHHREGGDFLMVHEKESSFSSTGPKAKWAMCILGLMILLTVIGWLDIFKASLLAASLMFICGCVTSASARRSIDLTVVIGIGSALGISEAVRVSGLADAVASNWMSLFGNTEWSLMLGIYLLTWIMTMFLTNNASAVLVFPLVLSVATEMQVDPRPLLVVLALASSASFATPIGYHTNLMVMGPGGYRFVDYLRFGLPLTFLHAIGTLALVPLLYD